MLLILSAKDNLVITCFLSILWPCKKVLSHTLPCNHDWKFLHNITLFGNIFRHLISVTLTNQSECPDAVFWYHALYNRNFSTNPYHSYSLGTVMNLIVTWLYRWGMDWGIFKKGITCFSFLLVKHHRWRISQSTGWEWPAL